MILKFREFYHQKMYYLLVEVAVCCGSISLSLHQSNEMAGSQQSQQQQSVVARRLVRLLYSQSALPSLGY